MDAIRRKQSDRLQKASTNALPTSRGQAFQAYKTFWSARFRHLTGKLAVDMENRHSRIRLRRNHYVLQRHENWSHGGGLNESEKKKGSAHLRCADIMSVKYQCLSVRLQDRSGFTRSFSNAALNSYVFKCKLYFRYVGWLTQRLAISLECKDGHAGGRLPGMLAG